MFVFSPILAELQKKTKSKPIKEAEKHDIQVVSEDFLEAVKGGGAALLITQHKISDWGSDVSFMALTSILKCIFILTGTSLQR